MSFDELRSTDVLVLGSGAAGLAVALAASPARSVTVLCKGSFARGGSSLIAQGGVAVSLGADDSARCHAEDTLAVGGGLCDAEIVRVVTEEGPQQIRDLVTLGAAFDRDRWGGLALGREAAHSRRRVVHAAGDATGAEIVRALAAGLCSREVAIEEQTLALDLIVEGGRVFGVHALTREGRSVAYLAQTVVLATGGLGGLFLHTTNPADVRGEGIAIAARAGARLAGMEFVQFHPTALAVGCDPMPLLTEALRGEGATLIDEEGRRFMEALHPLAELAPRDVVARAIWRHQLQGHRTMLDATGLGPRIAVRFPTVLALCRQQGFEPQREPLPVSPAAHYHMGGVVVDDQGRSSLQGLWACGEVAHTGLHGANRLASNSLLEALVYGARVGRALARRAPAPLPTPPSFAQGLESAAAPLPGASDNAQLQTELRVRELMWRHVGLEREATGLQRAQSALRALDCQLRPCPSSLRNMLLTAQLVTRAALAREESRGAHWRSDIPFSVPSWQRTLYFEGQTLALADAGAEAQAQPALGGVLPVP